MYSLFIALILFELYNIGKKRTFSWKEIFGKEIDKEKKKRKKTIELKIIFASINAFEFKCRNTIRLYKCIANSVMESRLCRNRKQSYKKKEHNFRMSM